MNDRNFIEESKCKPDEYGVTQTRFAVACGIGREYDNRIESGKLPLTEELKETLKKQIERFHPQEPLFNQYQSSVTEKQGRLLHQ